MAAESRTLQEIHEKVAKAFVALLSQMDGNCPNCHVSIHLPLNPAVYGHIIKFLKDNNIEAVAVPDSPLGKLSGKLHLLKDYMEPHERAAVGEDG